MICIKCEKEIHDATSALTQKDGFICEDCWCKAVEKEEKEIEEVKNKKEGRLNNPPNSQSAINKSTNKVKEVVRKPKPLPSEEFKKDEDIEKVLDSNSILASLIEADGDTLVYDVLHSRYILSSEYNGKRKVKFITDEELQKVDKVSDIKFIRDEMVAGLNVPPPYEEIGPPKSRACTALHSDHWIEGGEVNPKYIDPEQHDKIYKIVVPDQVDLFSLAGIPHSEYNITRTFKITSVTLGNGAGMFVNVRPTVDGSFCCNFNEATLFGQVDFESGALSIADSSGHITEVTASCSFYKKHEEDRPPELKEEKPKPPPRKFLYENERPRLPKRPRRKRRRG